MIRPAELHRGDRDPLADRSAGDEIHELIVEAVVAARVDTSM
jgi:hypothetical protein